MPTKSILLALAAVAALAAGSAQAKLIVPPPCNPDANGKCTIPYSPITSATKNAYRTALLVKLRAHLMAGWAYADTARFHGLVRKDAACTTAAAEGMALIDQAAGQYFKIVEFSNQFPIPEWDGWASAAVVKIDRAKEITFDCAGVEGQLRAQKYQINALERPRPIADIPR